MFTINAINFFAMQIKTNSKTQFYVELHSTCLEEMKKTDKNSVVDSGKKHFNDDKSSGQYSYPEWNKTVIPVVSTVCSRQLNKLCLW